MMNKDFYELFSAQYEENTRVLETLALADELGVPLMLSPAVHNLMRMAKGLGYEQDDATAILRVYEDTMNRQLKLTI